MSNRRSPGFVRLLQAVWDEQAMRRVLCHRERWSYLTSRTCTFLSMFLTSMGKSFLNCLLLRYLTTYLNGESVSLFVQWFHAVYISMFYFTVLHLTFFRSQFLTLTSAPGVQLSKVILYRSMKVCLTSNKVAHQIYS